VTSGHSIMTSGHGRVSLTAAARHTGVKEDMMKAAVLHAVGEPLRVEEVPTPHPGPGQVLVKIAAAGVCHSDLHLRDGSVPPFRLPLIMGHENAGWVAALGPGAVEPGTAGVAEGDPVVVYGGWGCGHCRFCLGGQEQLCDTMRWSGLAPDGGYAEYLLVPAARHLLPAGSLDLVRAAGLTDAGLTPYRAVKKALPHLLAGTTAVVIGVGGLGQYGIQYLKLLTSATVIAVETAAAKRQLALSLGADHAIDGSAVGALEQIRELSGGEGPAAVIDFVGVDATMRLGLTALARQGLFVLVGLAGGTVPVGFFTQATEAAVTTSNWGSRNDLAEVLALAQEGKLTATTESHRLDDINDVLKRLEHGLVEGRAVVVP
jgi:alcohol dehydrogenase, propanol-preferring